MQTKSTYPITLQTPKPGTLVRLLQPFRPDPKHSRTYTYGIIAGLVEHEPTRTKKNGKLGASPAAVAPLSAGKEVILSLYDPISTMLYVDEFGDQALFSFKGEEVELID